MSYDISLTDPVTKEILEADFTHHITGGTYAVGGTRKLELNVTWNYCKFYYGDKAFGDNGIKSLDGITGAESIPVLKKAISNLGDDVSPEYWDATEGNAKRALCGLLALAQIRPDGVWEVM